MCAIFGSSNSTHFVRLYLANKPRGGFSFGVAVLPYNTNQWVISKTTNSEDMLRFLENYTHTGRYYLGHIQAPTGSDRNINDTTIHPFAFDDIHVAHNGILTNFEELKSEFNCHEFVTNVDSSIIPYIISYYKKSGKDTKEAIIETCNKLKGTFSMWVTDSKTGDVYISRLSSTLFKEQEWFSSVRYMEMTEVPEQTLFKLDLTLIHKEFRDVGTFIANSHFFTL